MTGPEVPEWVSNGTEEEQKQGVEILGRQIFAFFFFFF